MLIYLLRHGRAEVGYGMRDDDRALTEDGWDELRRAAPAWRQLVPSLDVIVSSPLRRAQETAQVLLEAVDGDPEQRTDTMIVPSGDPQRATELIAAELAGGTDSIAFVGHEPHLGSLLGLLLTGDRSRPVPLKKGMLVAVELAGSTSLIGTLKFSLSSQAAAEFA